MSIIYKLILAAQRYGSLQSVHNEKASLSLRITDPIVLSNVKGSCGLNL